ncbi:hypothetical protein FHS76_001052 [Ochrobactrum daejeonense]|uniref:DUF995 domain-containing protein n=2 Tax=Brucella daejeonensis TaxID=659015 RepID=A0A7W9EKE2_9HYPH|nr:DUF995 domain-containing protein [Brucella daejeonensis]MBB5701203.1 hypothetical protein [Brucella daejeonensis]NKB79743.1 DUF995 domain-containing protein [Brucella daejeonensis]
MKHSIRDGGRAMSARYRQAAALLALGATLAGPAVAASMPEGELPGGTRVMTPAEIYTLYRDKDWRWSDGAGRMESRDRRFTARVDGENGRAWAEGRWRITWSGRMCLDASWHLDQGVFPNKTCFSHRIGDGTIYQKREPDGVWYVFRHAGGRKSDEARKLVSIEKPTAKTDDPTLASPVTQSPTQ